MTPCSGRLGVTLVVGWRDGSDTGGRPGVGGDTSGRLEVWG